MVAFLATPAVAAEKAAEKADKKGTCCELAKAENKECSHKCCAAAHRNGKSCERCNPNKEDLKGAEKKAEKRANSK
jgi:hypothetical protein